MTTTNWWLDHVVNRSRNSGVVSADVPFDVLPSLTAVASTEEIVLIQAMRPEFLAPDH